MVKMYKIKFLKITMGFLLMVVFGSKHITAQNAKDLFTTHFKWGVTGQFNTFKAADITETPENPNVKYAILKSQLMAVGLSYNFYQYKNWNFRAGLQLQWFGNAQELYLAKEEIVIPYDYADWARINHDLLVYVPVTAEFVFLRTGSFYFTLGGGFGLTYYAYDKITRVLSIGNTTAPTIEEQVFNVIYYNSKPPFYGSAHIEGSIFFKRKSFLLQASLIYNKSFKSYRTGTYTFMNLQVSPDVTGTIDQSGDFLGVSLTFYLKKIDFKKLVEKKKKNN